MSSISFSLAAFFLSVLEATVLVSSLLTSPLEASLVSLEAVLLSEAVLEDEVTFVAVFTAEPVEATLFVLLPLSPIKRLINPYAPIIPAAIIVTTTTATRPLFSFLLFLLYAFLLFLYELPLIPTSFQITFYLQQLSTFITQQNEYKFVNINCQAYFT